MTKYHIIVEKQTEGDEVWYKADDGNGHARFARTPEEATRELINHLKKTTQVVAEHDIEL